MTNKYQRHLKGATVDVYDVIKAFNVTCPALQHLLKKALCCGLRGHKDQMQDLQDIVDSAHRAQELATEDVPEERDNDLLAHTLGDARAGDSDHAVDALSYLTQPGADPFIPIGPGTCNPLTYVESPEGHRAWVDYHERRMAVLAEKINEACDNKTQRDLLQAEYDEHERLAGEHALKATVGGGDAR